MKFFRFIENNIWIPFVVGGILGVILCLVVDDSDLDFLIITSSLAGPGLLFWLLKSIASNIVEEKKEKAKLKEKEIFLKAVENGEYQFPVSEYYTQCKSAGFTSLSGSFYTKKAKLIADDILKKNNVPAEYYHLYDSEKKLSAYLKAGEKEIEEKETQKRREADRIASTPHAAEVSEDERETIALQNKIAKLSGKEKREYLLSSSIQKIEKKISSIEEGKRAALELGVMVSQSAAKEKTMDWSVAGGIASGIAGPAAGLAVAADISRKNAEIERRNMQNQAAVNKIADRIISSAFDSSTDTSSLRNQVWTLKKELDKLPSKVVMDSIDISDINNALHILNYNVKKCRSNALEVTLDISNTYVVKDVPKGIRFTTDGSLKGSVYAGNLFVDTVNIPLPVMGIECGKMETIKVYCGKYSKNGKPYTVTVEPNKLWVMEV